PRHRHLQVRHPQGGAVALAGGTRHDVRAAQAAGLARHGRDDRSAHRALDQHRQQRGVHRARLAFAVCRRSARVGRDPSPGRRRVRLTSSASRSEEDKQVRTSSLVAVVLFFLGIAAMATQMGSDTANRSGVGGPDDDLVVISATAYEEPALPADAPSASSDDAAAVAAAETAAGGATAAAPADAGGQEAVEDAAEKEEDRKSTRLN